MIILNLSVIIIMKNWICSILFFNGSYFIKEFNIIEINVNIIKNIVKYSKPNFNNVKNT